MMQPNFLIVLLAALIPLFTGYIWYHKSLFGTAWTRTANMTEEQLKGGNMAKVFILTFIFSFLIAFAMEFLTIHQWSLLSMVANAKDLDVPTSDAHMMLTGWMDKYGTEFRTFKHGLFHGVEFAIILIFPIMAINAMFEKKSFKYIFINAGFWIVTLALMGGVICQYGMTYAK